MTPASDPSRISIRSPNANKPYVTVLGKNVKTQPSLASAGDLGMEAYLKLKDEICEGRIAPGTRITEEELTGRLKMSRTPIRVALYRLESDGLLTREARRGLIVTRPGHQEVMELYAMREALEGTAARLAAQHASEVEIEALGELIAGEAKFLSDTKALSDLNKRIHGLIYLAAHNRYLVKVLDNMTSTGALLPTLLGNLQRAKEAHEEHQEILRAITKRDADGAERASRKHMRTARKMRLTMMLSDDSGG